MYNKEEIKVSVCVVTYNQEKYIAECLQSLVDQVTDFPFEIIVGEDCSTDRTREIVDDFALRYPDLIVKNYHSKNVGPTKNVFSTYALAKGIYIAHLDGDDIALPGKISKQATYLDMNPNCKVVWSRMKILDDSAGSIYDDLLNSDLVLSRKYTQEDLIIFGSIACHSSKMFRKSTLKNLHLPDGEVYDFYLDVKQVESGYGCILPSFMGVYRSGVGISRASGINKVYIENIKSLLCQYPTMKPFFSARLLFLFLVQIKRKEFNNSLLNLFLSNFGIKTLKSIFKILKSIKYFKSPI